MVGGAVWGGIVGVLKAFTGAHEVVTTIMLNYVAIYFLQYLLVGGPLQAAQRQLSLAGRSRIAQIARASSHRTATSCWSARRRLPRPSGIFVASGGGGVLFLLSRTRLAMRSAPSARASAPRATPASACAAPSS